MILTNMLIALAIFTPLSQSCLADLKLEDKNCEKQGFVTMLPVGCIRGAPGLPGKDGKAGIAGIPGLSGPPGKDGEASLPGPSGTPGGLPGKDGLPGLPGLEGRIGLPGFDGLPGLSGHNGQPGVVPKPQAVAFTVKAKTLAFKTPSSEDRRIPFAVIQNNIGGDFHQDVSEFTCRIPGLYFFTFNFLSNVSDGTNCYVQIMHGKQMIVAGYGRGIFGTCSGQAILVLKKGERVWLKLRKDTAIESNQSDNSFSGFLIQAM